VKKIVLGKAYLINQSYKKRIQVGESMRGIGEFVIQPPENMWTIVVEIISYDSDNNFYWVHVSFAFFETAPQESLFANQIVYLSDGQSRIFQIFLVDNNPSSVTIINEG
jgi:hypothetical protein